MQVALADEQILNQHKLCHLGTQFATDASGASWWPNLQSVQVAPSGDQNVETMDDAWFFALFTKIYFIFFMEQDMFV